MKKLLLLAGILLMLATMSANAQVTIGAKQDPQSYSALEIISNGSNGLRLPQLTTTQRNDITASGKMLAEGLMIFNIDTKCVDYWNGSKWMNLCAGSLDEDLSGNYLLSGKICFDVKQINNDVACKPLNSRPNDFASTKSFAYTFSSPTGLTYSNLNFWVSDENGLVATTNTANNVFTVTFRKDINTMAAGRDKANALILTIVAQYKDNTGTEKQVSLVVSVQDCGCACTVRSTLPVGWLTFMCYNLGAKEMSIAEQMNYTPNPNIHNTTDATVYGNLYQWGRKSDGYESRTSPTYPTDVFVSISDPNSGEVTGDAVGQFIKGASYPYDWRSPQSATLWGASKTANDPCPAGWRVPTTDEFQSIFDDNTAELKFDYGTCGIYPDWNTTALSSVNKIRWNGNSNTHGLEISPDEGTTTALFLPAAGYRSSTTTGGAVYTGYYWSATPTGTDPHMYSYYLLFAGINNSVVSPSTVGINRAYGYSVRCVAE